MSFETDPVSRAALEEARNRPTCELCGQAFYYKLQPHHVVTRGKGGENEVSHPWNLLSLCIDCHAGIHTEGLRFVLQTLVARCRGTTRDRIREFVRQELAK